MVTKAERAEITVRVNVATKDRGGYAVFHAHALVDILRLLAHIEALEAVVEAADGRRVESAARQIADCPPAVAGGEGMSVLAERLREILAEEFHAGTRVTNCVAHMNREFDARPEDCRLCRVDIVNHMRYAVRVNEWLNARLEEARAVLAEERMGVQERQG